MDEMRERLCRHWGAEIELVSESLAVESLAVESLVVESLVVLGDSS